jgi:hypothetical protein
LEAETNLPWIVLLFALLLRKCKPHNPIWVLFLWMGVSPFIFFRLD